MSAQLALALEERASIVDALRAAGVPYQAVRTLELAPIAEEEIERAGAPAATFALLSPRRFVELHPELYRAHARELCERVVAGKDTRPGTRAEVLVGLLQTCLLAPLTGEGQAFAEQLFGELMPDARAVIFGSDEPVREMWEGQIAEELHAARRRLAVADRRLP